MGGGKPTVPEKMMGTSTSSDYNSAHTSSFINMRYISCAVAALEHLEPFGPVNYGRIVAFSPGSLRVFVYGETISIRYSITMKSLPHTIYIYNGLIRALEPCYDDRKSSSALCLLSRANSYEVATPVGTSVQSNCRSWLVQNGPVSYSLRNNYHVSYLYHQ